jgi:ABC-type transport system involved in multi-copper enzyme maturation permease subunit
VVFYLGLSVIYVFANDVSRMEDLYGVFLFSGLLLVFYPAVFGIQNDLDARTIEILFGIPNYRYKVWFVRIVLIFLVAFAIMLGFTFLSSVLIVKFRILKVSLQIMIPVLFMGLLGFMLSTVVRNGNGTAVILIIIGLIFMMMSDSALGRSQWNIFLNPFHVPYGVNETSWALITFKNRIILLTGSVIFLLAALLNLQRREKFM